MQETMKPSGKPHQEIFHAPSEADLEDRMNKRLKDLKKQGHTLSRRVPIKRLPNRYRNKPCPCGSGKKVKQCCALNTIK
jgi:uncharacterized protein YecA (UPF0149 family)